MKIRSTVVLLALAVLGLLLLSACVSTSTAQRATTTLLEMFTRL